MAEEEGKAEQVADPVSSALVLGGKAAGELVTPKLRELLFGRLAKAYGDHWGAKAEERLRQRREEKHALNAYSHIQAVSRLEPTRRLEDVSDEPTFDEWLAGAAAVDPDVDPDLADFWRAALLALAQGESTRLRLLRITKSLTPDEAAYLAAGKVEGTRFHPAPHCGGLAEYEQHFERNGVFENPWQELRTQPLMFLIPAIGAVAMYVAITTAPFMRVTNINPEYADRIAFPAALGALIVFAMPLLAKVSFTVRRLTPDGARLLALLEKVRSAPPPVRPNS